MPRAYRPMKAEGDPPRPVLGESATKLGVREKDLSPDDDGNAQPDKGGVSVVSSIAGLRRRIAKGRFSPSMVPQRLHDLGKIPGAMGNNSLHLFRIGDGPFESGPLTEKLRLEPDVEDHGTIQPAHIMPYDEYKQAIVDTKDLWQSRESNDDSDAS